MIEKTESQGVGQLWVLYLSLVHFSPRCFNRQGRNTRKKIPDHVACEPAGGDLSLSSCVCIQHMLMHTCEQTHTHTYIALFSVNSDTEPGKSLVRFGMLMETRGVWWVWCWSLMKQTHQTDMSNSCWAPDSHPKMTKLLTALKLKET